MCNAMRVRLFALVDARLAHNGLPCERVANFIERVSGVPLDPLPREDVLALKVTKLDPKVLVFDSITRTRLPPISLPSVEPPFGEGVFDVGAVGDDVHFRGAQKGFEPANDAKQLHAVVRGSGIVARQAALSASRDQHAGPAARSWVAGAGTVGIELHFGRHRPPNCARP